MSKTISVDDDAYKILAACKEGPRDSFSKVIKRKIFVPIEDVRQLMEAYDKLPPPDVDPDVLEIIKRGRGRRSNRKK